MFRVASLHIQCPYCWKPMKLWSKEEPYGTEIHHTKGFPYGVCKCRDCGNDVVLEEYGVDELLSKSVADLNYLRKEDYE